MEVSSNLLKESILRELKGKKVKGNNHKSVGFVVSQIPDFKTGLGFVCRVAWDVSSLQEAVSLPETYLQEEHSDYIELVCEE